MLSVIWHIFSGDESEFDIVNIGKHSLNKPSRRFERVIMNFFIQASNQTGVNGSFPISH